MMTTSCKAPAPTFLPFNMGDHGAAGNPPNGKGHRTPTLWEQVWQRDSWLEIIAPPGHPAQRRKKRRLAHLPRYHQLDATRKLVAAVLARGGAST